ncbi:MAG: DinB family protein [Vicinamibacterales bacterium]
MKTLAHPADAAEILRRLQNVRANSARRWGRMTAHQMICHLGDSARMALGRTRVVPTGGMIHRTLVKVVALYAPFTWRTGILTNPEIDQECGGTKPAEFRADVKDLEALVEVMTTDAANLDGQVHPIFGRLSRAAWLRWAYLHMDHHLRQFGF